MLFVSLKKKNSPVKKKKKYTEKSMKSTLGLQSECLIH